MRFGGELFMASSVEFDTLVHRIYDAASDATRYPAVAEQISRTIGADGVTLIMHTTDTQEVLSAGMVNYDHLPVADVFAEYGRDWHAQNPQVLFERAEPSASLYYEGCHETFNCDNNREFQQWREAKIGIKSQLTGYCRPTDRLTYAFAFSSHDSYRPESRKQVELLDSLMGHLRQSVSLAYRIGTLQGQNHSLLDHLEALRGPVAVVNAQGQPVFVNDAMTDLLRATSLLTLEPSGLRALLTKENARLQRLLASAINAPQAGGAMLLNNGSEQPLLVHVAPLTNSFWELGIGHGAAIVTVTDWRTPTNRIAETFRSALELTFAEAEVAVFLMTGRPDDEIAAAIGVAVSTIRSHVRAILEKAHLHSKAELAHLLTLIAR